MFEGYFKPAPVAAALFALLVLQPRHGDAQAPSATEQAPAAAHESALDHWWLGAYYRHLWVPAYMTDPFFSRAPSVSEDGLGLVATYRSGSGFNVVMGAGYMPYGFSGTFISDGGAIEDAEIVRSDLAFVHLTSSLLWDVRLHEMVAFELGFGLDVGVVTGDVTRNEAYYDRATGRFVDCEDPLKPALLGPNGDPYCNVPENGSYNAKTGKYRSDKGVKGEQYRVREGRIPPVMLFPMLPHLALRVQPLDDLALKVEFAFSGVQMWLGASVHGSFGVLKGKAAPPPPPPVVEAPLANGRVLGVVVQADSGAAVAGAQVRATTSALPPTTSDAEGKFSYDGLPAGLVRFEVTHPDYTVGACQVEVPSSGGDVALTCQVATPPRVGAISGQVVGEGGEPVATPNIQLFGPVGTPTERFASNQDGVFAAVDLPVGTYRVRVEADDYLVQMVEIEVALQETAMPKVVLVKKPQRPLVELRKQEIVISEQIQFAPKSAEIAAGSEGLLRQVADALLRHPEIALIEVQGHTDTSGGRAMNMELSQQRADSVRAWLVKAGIAESRLEAKGYGPDKPLLPNTTAQGRAKNRRVQFIIRKRGAEAAPEGPPAPQG